MTTSSTNESGLQRRILRPTVVLALLAMVPLAVFSLLTMRLASDAVQDQAEGQVESAATASAVAVQQQLEGLAQVVEAYSQRPSLRAYLQAGAGDRGPDDVGLLLDELSKVRPGISLAFVADIDGVALAIAPESPDAVGQDFSFRDWYRGVTATERPYVSEAYRTAATGTPLVMVAAVPVRVNDLPGAPIIGIVAAGYRLDTVQSFVDEYALGGVELTVTDQAGVVVAEPGRPPSDIVSIADDPRIAAALNGTNSIDRYDTTDRGNVLGAVAPVAELGWTVRAERDTGQALAPVRNIRNAIAGIAVVIAIALLAGLIAFNRNLRRRTQAEADLDTSERARHESEATQRLVLALSGLGTAVVDLESGRVQRSDRMDEIHGLEPGTSAQNPKRSYERLHPDDTDIPLQVVGDAINDGSDTYEMEYRVIDPDGSMRWVYVQGGIERDETGRAISVAAVGVDVTDRRAAVQAVRQSEVFLDSVIENIPDMVFVKDAKDLRFVRINRAGEELVGRRREELVGYGDADFFPPEQAEHFLEKDREVLRSGELLDIESEVIESSDGRELTLHTKKIPIMGPDGNAEFLLGISEDITERIRVERELREAKEAADRANNAKSEFLSQMSHELRTPLNSVIGFGQLLALADLPEDHRDNLAQIDRAGRHLLSLINEMLDIARVESGRLSLSLEPVLLSDVAEEAVDLLRPLAQLGKVTLPDSPISCAFHVRADRQRLSQVLLNLVTNSIKYNREGGEVHITCESRGADRVRLTVIDTGIGIAANRREMLFVPFERLGAESSGIEGTGLGLPLVKGLVEAMGGTVGVDTEEGAGSRFWLELERTATPEQTMSVAAERDPSPLGIPRLDVHKTVLYVEDNLANVRLVERILEQRPNVDLLIAMQGGEGVELALEHQPDLILLDLNLPDTNGEVVLRRLRSEPSTAHIPVVVVSADATRPVMTRLRRGGAHDFLTKPFDLERLLAVVDGDGDGDGDGDAVSAQPVPQPSDEVENPTDRSANPPADTPGDRPEGVLDPRVLSSLRTLASGGEGFDELIETFLDVGIQKLVEIRSATDSGDIAELAASTHSLKGTAGGFGATDVTRHCIELEQRCGTGDLTDIDAVVGRIETSFAEAAAELREQFPPSGGGR